MEEVEEISNMELKPRKKRRKDGKPIAKRPDDIRVKITIHRGTDQIGGCVTEYEHDGWHLFVDYGEPLPGSPKSDKPLEVESLTYGDVSKSALLITHYHEDHIGRICELPADLPIYMGSVARDIYKYSIEHKRFVLENSSVIIDRLDKVHTFSPGKEFHVGPFKIMPIVIDHSAFDAYAFKIEADKLKVFHTGDFRTHGFRSKKLPEVIEKYIGKVDYLVCEATNVDRPNNVNEPEQELQKRFEKTFRENKYNIVYLSSTNIDRLFSLYHASIRAGRKFYVDGYQLRMMNIVTNRDRLWGKSRNYKYDKENKPEKIHREGDEFKFDQEFADSLNDEGYVLIARANPRFDNLIAKMPGVHKTRYLSMWRGYVDPKCAAYNPSLANSLTDDYCYMHTSGHCDMESLRDLVEMVNPRAIIPIHTEDPKAFADLFKNKWPVLLLKDGESISPISYKYSDDVDAKIIAVRQPEDNWKEIENVGGYKWWSLDEKHLGDFKSKEEALHVLKTAVFDEKRLLGYSVEPEEDSGAWDTDVYDSDFNLLANYSYGGHEPGGSNFQEPCRFKSGEVVWAVIGSYYNLVLPSVVVGPITVEKAKKELEDDPLVFEEFEDIRESRWDWDWDAVEVRPLVRLEDGGSELPETILVRRIFLFPMKELDA